MTRRTWPQRLLIGFNVCFVLAMLVTASGLAYVYTKYSRLPRVELGSALDESVESGEPRNILIVGVDSAAGLDPADPVRSTRGAVGGMRSDTMMILRIDPGSERAALLSLPRDLWVPIAGGGNQRINDAAVRATAGLQPGDVILRVNDTDVESVQELRMAVLRADRSRPIRIEVMRDRRRTRLELPR